LQSQGYAFRVTDLVRPTAALHRPLAEVEIDVTLPAPTPLAASFAPEKGYHRLVKLLREEIQTGDDAFDAAVYISTDSPAAARALLDKPRAREIVQRRRRRQAPRTRPSSSSRSPPPAPPPRPSRTRAA
ncbi:MAG: hypothetical protein KBO60_21785, partial [Achromobacter sp.]|nr:hypothetical protein [Achromobacter sp.]